MLLTVENHVSREDTYWFKFIIGSVDISGHYIRHSASGSFEDIVYNVYDDDKNKKNNTKITLSLLAEAIQTLLYIQDEQG